MLKEINPVVLDTISEKERVLPAKEKLQKFEQSGFDKPIEPLINPVTGKRLTKAEFGLTWD